MSNAASWASPAPRALTAVEVAERLKGESRIVAVSHEAPDGDALGCVSALTLVAQQLGIPCRAYIPGVAAFPPEYLFLPGVDTILRGAPPAIDPGTSLYLLDCASLLRSSLEGFEGEPQAVNVDHHQDNPGYGEFNFIDPSAPSTTAILYEVFKAGGFHMDPGVATALYVGLVTDTGCFQFSNTTPAAHRVAAELQELGVDVNWVYRHVYESRPLPKLLLLRRALNHLEVRLGGALVTSWLGEDDFVQTGADEGHAEGIIDELRRIQGVRVAALLREGSSGAGKSTKVSLRSTDGLVNVAAIAGKRGGGGHLRAAGFTSEDGAEAIKVWIEDEVAALVATPR